jgi:hypothetical protein
MNIGRFLGFVVAGALWEAFGRERARPYIAAGAERLTVIGEELVEGYKGGMAGAAIGSSANRRSQGARTAAATKRTAPAPTKPRATTAAAAPKPKGRPPSQATMDKRRIEARNEALARGRETRKKNLEARRRADTATK